MRKLYIVVTLACTTFLLGCVAVPKTKIKGKVNNQPFEIVTPKDTDVDGLEVVAKGTNEISVKILKLKTRMSPDVINQTAAGQAELINASLTGAGAITAQAVEAAIKAYLGQLPVTTVITNK